MSDTEIRTTSNQVRGWPCPRCGGWGRNADGMCSIGQNMVTGEVTHMSREPSKCYLCRGKGRVNVTPLEDA